MPPDGGVTHLGRGRIAKRCDPEVARQPRARVASRRVRAPRQRATDPRVDREHAETGGGGDGFHLEGAAIEHQRVTAFPEQAGELIHRTARHARRGLLRLAARGGEFGGLERPARGAAERQGERDLERRARRQARAEGHVRGDVRGHPSRRASPRSQQRGEGRDERRPRSATVGRVARSDRDLATGVGVGAHPDPLVAGGCEAHAARQRDRGREHQAVVVVGVVAHQVHTAGRRRRPGLPVGPVGGHGAVLSLRRMPETRLTQTMPGNVRSTLNRWEGGGTMDATPMPRPAILAVSHLSWDLVFQRPQHLMTRAAQDRTVLYVEEARYDAETPGWEQRTTPQGVTVCVPRLPPDMAPDRRDALLAAMVEALVAQHDLEPFVLWFETPMSVAHTAGLQPVATVYDCMDELSAFDHAPPELRANERALLARADVVFTGGLALYEHKRHEHPAVHPFPSGVDVAHFARARDGLAEPSDQRSILGPKIGFFGVVDERMD